MIIFFLIFVGKRVKLLKRVYQVTQVNSCGILCSRETLSSQSSTFLSVHSSSSHVLGSLGGFSQQPGAPAGYTARSSPAGVGANKPRAVRLEGGSL